MPTTPLPRRAARIAAVTALTAALTPLTGMPTSGAAPMAPGDNGTLKIHTAPPGTFGWVAMFQVTAVMVSKLAASR